MANSASFSWSMASSPPPETNKNDPKGCSILPVPCVSQLSSDNGFAERAARFSCFRSVVMDNSAHLNKLHVPSTSMDEALTFSNHPETLSKRSGAFPLGCSPALGNLGNSECDEAEVSTAYRQAHAVEESCSSEQVTGEGVSASQKMTPINARKRKQQPSKDANPDKQIKTAEVDESKNLRQKVTESIKERDDVKAKVETSSNRKAAEGSPNEAEENAQGSDYIHVRARRGQATNSHSLAERVRREKISERMKFLQDLVPGCSKVTGKAVMLDEIINYVQSLQRQVEFLSMKLAAVNPQIDLNVSRILAKDGSSAAMMFTSDPSTSYPHFHHPQHGIVQVGSEVLSRTITSQLPCIDGFDSNNTQLPNVWDDELQSVVQMGFGHNTHIPQTSQQRGIGPVTMPHMKPDV